jgi:hypothetical protein
MRRVADHTLHLDQAKRVAETLLEQPPAPVGETEVMMEYMI